MKNKKAIFFSLLLWTPGLCTPAFATQMLNVAVTAAVSNQVSGTLQVRSGNRWTPASATFQANFTGGSGGTSADAYVQTSVDGGVTWTDVCNFHFTVAARLLCNVSSSAFLTTLVPTDGTLASNTGVSGIFGPLWRVKYTTVGIYSGTTLRVDAVTSGLTTP